jgi:signal recognition particle subunit SRP54
VTAQAFLDGVGYDGVVLTKLDGDARGGAALSIAALTGKPVMFASTGEKLSDFDLFHPDRMATRILDMGDVLSLIERAEKAASEEETAQMEARLRKGQFTFDDFLAAQKMLRRMGPLQGILKLMPGMGQLADADVDESKLGRAEAIVLSMTPRERSMPHTIDGRRRLRIANGSGTSVQEVNQLLEARKMMEKMMGQMGKGKMPPGLPGMPGMDGFGVPGGPPAVAPLERRSGNRKRKANKKRSGRR